jgi:putative flippase GtrA
MAARVVGRKMKIDEYIALAEGKPVTVLNVPWASSQNGKGQGNVRHISGRSGRGRHRRPKLLKKIGLEHGKRLMSFSLIGFGVFAAGIGVQMVLVQVIGIPKVQAYILQLVLSVQVNFLANYRWTWGDRQSPFWRSCWRYNIKRLIGTLLNMCLYPVLVHYGMNYLAANALLVVALTPVNYILGDLWTFATDGEQVRKKKFLKTASWTEQPKESPQVQLG